MRHRERLERGVARIPAAAEAVRDPAEVPGDGSILEMRRVEPEPSFEDRAGPVRSGAGEKRRRDPALRRPARVQKLRLRPVYPAFQQTCGEAADDARRIRQALGVQLQKPAGKIRHTERREQSAGMKTQPMKLAGRHRADATRDFVADGDGGDQIAAGNGTRDAELCQRQRGGHRRTAHVDNRLEMRVVVLERLRERSVRERRHRDADPIAGAEDVAGARRRHRHRRLADRLAKPGFGSRQREADDIEDPELRRLDDIRRQIPERGALHPAAELERERSFIGNTESPRIFDAAAAWPSCLSPRRPAATYRFSSTRAPRRIFGNP